MLAHTQMFPEDLFEVLGELRPSYRWLVVGPARTGTVLCNHIASHYDFLLKFVSLSHQALRGTWILHGLRLGMHCFAVASVGHATLPVELRQVS